MSKAHIPPAIAHIPPTIAITGNTTLIRKLERNKKTYKGTDKQRVAKILYTLQLVISDVCAKFQSRVRFSVTFHLMFVHLTFSSGRVAQWPPFGK